MTWLPIVERELRVAARQPSTSLLRFLVALVGIILWLGLWGARHSRTTPADIGGKLFVALGVLLFVWCALAGVFLTADCLSSEKREGTLGLLFLTDLRGYDIVLGKLASTSLRSVSAVLALLPVLALPLLLGGVTAAEFWRVVLALLVTLFLSLTCGLFMSAITRQSRAGMGGTFLFLFFTNAVLPLLFHLVDDVNPSPGLKRLLLWPSQTYLLERAWSSNTSGATFWSCVITSATVATLFTLMASTLLPLACHDRSKATRGNPNVLRRYRTLSADPVYRLAQHQQPSRLLIWTLLGLLAGVCLAFVVSSFITGRGSGFNRSAFLFSFVAAFAVHQFFKYIVAAEASRRLSEDRISGMLELLLVTPLTPKRIVAAYRRALWDLLHGPFLLTAGLNVILLIYVGIAWPFGSVGSVPWWLAILGGMVLLATDYYGLSWVGMWQALGYRRHHRAVLNTLASVMLPPWLMFVLVVFAFGPGSMGGPGDVFACWFVISAITSLMSGHYAQSRVEWDFRKTVRACFESGSCPRDHEHSHRLVPSPREAIA